VSVSIRDHAAAIQARLEQDSVLAGSTFQGIVTERPQRYCTFFLTSGARFADRLAGPDVAADFTVTVHSVGQDPTQAQAVAERVFAQLLNFTPTVAGRSCSWLRHTGSMATQIDETISPPLYYNADEFTFFSRPA
jgi:hypothetical protein